MKVSEAALFGRRDLLEALRDVIAAQIDAGVPPRELAPLSKRLVDISAELDLLIAADGGDLVAEAARIPAEPFVI